MVALFRLSNLMAFYLHTLAGLLGHEAQLVQTLRAVHDRACGLFRAALAAHGDKLQHGEPLYASDLSPPHAVVDVIARLAELLTIHERSMLPSDASNVDVSDMVSALYTPLLHVCQASCSGLDRADGAIFMMNNIHAMQAALSRFSSAADWVQRLAELCDHHMDALVEVKTAELVHRMGLGSCLDALRAESETPAPEREGCKPDQVATALRSFYAALFSLEMPAFDRLLSSRLRVQARNSIAQGLAAAYADLHAHVVAHFDQQVQAALAHDPSEVRTLLDV